MSTPAVLMVYCTLPTDDVATAVAKTVVEEKLAACVNLIPAIRSIYRWQGKVCDDPEILAIIKTTHDRLAALTERIVALHPYDCPEVVAVSVKDGHVPYLAWVHDSVNG